MEYNVATTHLNCLRYFLADFREQHDYLAIDFIVILRLCVCVFHFQNKQNRNVNMMDRETK